MRRGTEPAISSPPFALLVPSNEWWTAVWNDPAAGTPFPHEVYVDICTPAEWSGAAVESVDLDLDVVRGWDGTSAIHDLDEFVAHSAALGYPPDVMAAAQRAADEMLAAVTERAEPFGDVGPTWLKAAIAL